MPRSLTATVTLLLTFALTGIAWEVSQESLASDDECLAGELGGGGAGCSLSALQLQGVRTFAERAPHGEISMVEAAISRGPEGSDLDADAFTEDVAQESPDVEAPDTDDIEAKAPGTDVDDASVKIIPDLEHNLTNLRGKWHGWAKGGDKVWGVGSGVESISSGNVGYYDTGMHEAYRHCHGPRCVLLTNPPGQRTSEIFHVHFFRYKMWGARLKHRLQKKVCEQSGWHSGDFPCSGKAAFFPGFPGVFSQAMSAGSIHHASVIAWPSSCGGKGTIVQVAHGCSIEHKLRGDYNRFKR